MNSSPLFVSEEERQELFPVTRSGIFLGHAGVTVLPAPVATAMCDYIQYSCKKHQEFGDVLKVVGRTRVLAARAVGAVADEVALLGPTSLGLSLFANGIRWNEGDEVLYYADDYPANVYPWMALAAKGVSIKPIETSVAGRLTPEVIEAAITPRTRLVALASCHYLTGWRIDVGAIGALLKERGILFSLDAIQTVGAFETPVDHVDFLSADAHKWMLGPLAIGIVYVARKNFDLCTPTLLGAWNVQSPEFIAQDRIEFVDSAQRYEPGVLNTAGIYGLRACFELFEKYGIQNISGSILNVRDYLEHKLTELGYEFLSPPATEPLRSGIITTSHPAHDPNSQFARLEDEGITASVRADRSGKKWLRFSPHFYNTIDEMDRVVDVLANRV